MISIFAALNGSILSGSAVPYAAARDGYFFQRLAQVHPQYHTPGVSICVLLLGVLLVLSGKYERLFNLVIFASWILYGMTAAAVMVLREKQPDLYRARIGRSAIRVPLLFVLGGNRSGTFNRIGFTRGNR